MGAGVSGDSMMMMTRTMTSGTVPPHYKQVKGIARSKGVDGTWRLLFTTTKGNSSGKLGPFVGEVLQEIDTDAGLCEFSVELVCIFGGDWAANSRPGGPAYSQLTDLLPRTHTHAPERKQT